MVTERTTQTFNPYPGLRPFRPEEDYLFFGREKQVAELLGILDTHRFVAVVGTSGSGKSSLVRCGLLSELQGGTLVRAGSRWDIAVMQPGGDPLRRLARALCKADLYDGDDPAAIPQVLATLTRSQNGLVEAARQSELEKGSNLLLVVDQFEEIFRFHEAGKRGQEQAPDFVRLLLTAVRQPEVPIYVVLTMRSDFLGDCSQFYGLAEAVNEGEYLIPRLTRDQSRAAIEGPARVAGGEISRRLVQRLLNDLGSETEQLPVLQHALMRTWDRWLADREAGEPVDFRHYEAVGGMQEALSRHADEVLESLPGARDRKVAEKIFKGLTEKGSDGRGIRRPTRIESLCAIADAEPESVARVVNAYRRPGVTLLMPGIDVELRPETVIDISHESLMRVWQRLRSWVEDESQSVRIFRRLAETASLWKAGRAGLYHDPDLQIARTWRDGTRPNADWAEQYGGGFEEAVEFLEASREAAEAAERAREAARKRELEQARALAATQEAAARSFKRFSAAMVVVALLAFGAMAYALLAHRDAERAREEVSHSLSVSDMIRGSELVDRSDSLRGLSFLLRSHDLDPSADAALQGAFGVLAGRTIPVPILQFSAGGPQILAVDVRERLLAAGDASGRVRVWNVESGELLSTLQHPSGTSVIELCFGEDEGLLAARSDRGTTCIWRWRDHEETARWQYPRRQAASKIQLVGSKPYLVVELSPPGARWMEVRDVAGNDSRFFRTVVGNPEGFGHFVTVPRGDSHELIVQTSETTLERQDVELRVGLVVLYPGPGESASGEDAADAEGATEDPISAFSASRDGSWLALARGGLVLVKDLRSSEKAVPLGSFPGRVTDVRFSDDARRLVACSDDGTVRILSVPSGQVLTAITPRTPAREAWLGLEGSVLFTVSADSRARLWNAETGEPLVEPFLHLGPYGKDPFMAGGSCILVQPASGRLRLLRTVSVPALPLALSHGTALSHLAWAPAGSHVATAGDDGEVRLWRSADGAQIAKLRHPEAVVSAEFSPDGSRLLTVDGRGDARIWRVEDQTEIVRIDAPQRVLSGTFSADGERIATRMDSAIVGVWSSASGAPIGPVLRHAHPVLVAAFGRESRSVVVGTDRGTIVVWDVESGREVHRFGGDGGPVRALRVDPLGERAAYVRADGLLRIASVAAGEEFLTTARDVLDLEWSEDGLAILVRCEDQTVRLLDAASGEVRGIPVDPRRTVQAARLHTGSLRVLTTSGSQVRVWDATTGQPLSLPLTHGQAQVTDAQFDPSGTRVAVAYDDGRLRIWETGFSSGDRERVQALLELAQSVLRDQEGTLDLTSAAHPLEEEIRRDSGPSDAGRLAAWYFSKPAAQTLSPGIDLPLASRWRRSMEGGDLEALRWAVLADPANPRYRARLALLRSIRSRDARSRFYTGRDLDGAVADAPEDPEVWFLRGLAHDLLGDSGEARSSFERARSLEEPDLAAVRERLGIFASLGMSPRTDAGRDTYVDLLDRAIALTASGAEAGEADSDELRARRLEALVAAGRFRDAKEDWERIRKSRTLAPDRIESLFLRYLDAARSEFDALSRDEREGRALEFTAAFFLRHFLPLYRGDLSEKWRFRESFAGLPETGVPRVPLVPPRATWRYLDDDTDPGGDWKEVDFDDSAWKSGPGRLGFPARDGRETILSRYNAAGEQTTTFYFRHRFRLEEIPQAPDFLFEILHDDGVIVYVNGVRVVRSRMPPDPVTRETFASETVGGETETTYVLFDPGARGLRIGDNVIAVEVHQCNAESSDIGFDLKLDLGAGAWRHFDSLVEKREGDLASMVEGMVPEVDGGELRDAARLALSPRPAGDVVRVPPDAWLARAHLLHGRWQLTPALEAAERAVALARAGAEHSPGDAEASARFRRSLYLRADLRTASGGSSISSDEDPRGTILPAAAAAADVTERFRCLDLGSCYNASRYDPDSWHSSSAPNRLDGLPQLFTSFGGVPYDARGIVQLNSGTYPEGMLGEQTTDINAMYEKKYPDRVTIPVSRAAAAVHILHGTIYGRVGSADESAAAEGDRSSEVVARLVFHFADGEEASVPIEWGADVVDWSSGSDLEDLRALAWDDVGGAARLFEKTWRSPSPEKVLSHLEFISEEIEAAPFLMAITLESE